MKDLVVLAADKDIEFALRGLFSRPAAIGIRPIDYDIFVEPGHDPACASHGTKFLEGFFGQYHQGLLLFDYEGCGKEDIAPDKLQQQLNQIFLQGPWQNNAKTIVIFPEIESWIWSKSPHVDNVIGWKKDEPTLRQWLQNEGWLEPRETKPARPKEAFNAALRTAGKPHSASLFKQMTEKVSLKGCTDSSFQELIKVLMLWFS